jgi:hypothetical protein
MGAVVVWTVEVQRRTAGKNRCKVMHLPELRAGTQEGRMTKYHAQRTKVGDITFASKAEARRYEELVILQYAGVISALTLQPIFHLSVNGVKIGKYIADFQYYQDGKIITEDVKGVRTPVYNLKKKLVKALYGVDILETK